MEGGRTQAALDMIKKSEINEIKFKIVSKTLLHVGLDNSTVEETSKNYLNCHGKGNQSRWNEIIIQLNIATVEAD